MKFEYHYLTRVRTPSDINEHLPYMYGTAGRYDSPNVVELGTRTGNSTSAWLAAIENKGGGHLWSVDMTEPRVPASWRESDLWTVHVGDDRDPDIIKSITDACGGQVDVLFIDTSHEYDHTIEELDLYVPLVRLGGTVLMHDTELGPSMDVARALNTWCGERGITWGNRTGNCGLGEFRIEQGA